MTNAYRDENSKPTFIGILSTDGRTTKRLYVNPVNGALKVDNNTTGTYPSGNIIAVDENGVGIGKGVSETNVQTPVAILINSSNQLLIDSN